MANLGDYAPTTVIYGKFTTYRPSTGAAYTLAGSPALSVYKDSSTTQSTTGVTLTADFDSVTGLNHFAIDTSADGTFYAAGSNFDIVITTGTVDSVSVVGSVVGTFSLHKTSALRPTTAGRTLDVSSGGEAGLDWANIGSPTTSVNLSGTSTKAVEPTVAGRTLDVSAGGEAGIDWANVGSPTTSLALTGTTIATTQKVDVETIKTNAVVNGGTVTFPTNATLASTTNLTAGTIATVSGNVNGSVGSVTGAVGSVTGAVGSVTGNVGGNVVGSVASVTGAVGSVTGNVGGNVTGSIGSLATQAKADVNAEVVDTLNVDTYAEPGQGTPAATTTLVGKIGYLYKAWRNRSTQTSSTYNLYNDDATTVDQKATFSDDTTTADRGEVATGP